MSRSEKRALIRRKQPVYFKKEALFIPLLLLPKPLFVFDIVIPYKWPLKLFPLD